MTFSNLMTPDQWLERVLYSGQITKVAQHLALVILALAHRQSKNGVSASMRDLEKVTGWGRSTLKDHLTELEMFVKVTTGQGRGKTMFELQGMIEDAIGTALASAIEIRQPDAKPVVASEPNTTPDTIVASRPDTTVVVSQPNTTPDTKRCGEPAGHKTSVQVASQPDAACATQPPAYKDTCASKESPSEIVNTRGSGAKFTPAPASRKHNPSPHMNGIGFVISQQHDLVIPAKIVAGWRTRFPDLPDLEAAMERLATTLLHRGITHPGWTCPEGWMAGVLSDMNQEASNKNRVTQAKVASTQRNQPTKTFRR